MVCVFGGDCGVKRRACGLLRVIAITIINQLTVQGKEDTLIFSLKHPGTTVHYFKAENVELLKT